ncbi:hypothetical protein [Peribacillus sp. TH27]|nr:hypothetical protein [Peribacillus sp. TH27]
MIMKGFFISFAMILWTNAFILCVNETISIANTGQDYKKNSE